VTPRCGFTKRGAVRVVLKKGSVDRTDRKGFEGAGVVAIAFSLAERFAS
jgi:hypothetical protein